MLISEIPIFPQYTIYVNRMESFEIWPKHLPAKKEDLVEVGLVFTGVCDNVHCLFCGGELRNGEQDAVPMEEHNNWYLYWCLYVLFIKNQANVEKHVYRNSSEINPYKSVAAQSCLENDYPEEKVKQAIDIYIQRNGTREFKGRDLCEIIFELEENDDQ
ncbi:death-associated inhibitor of apoptosis 1-like [Mercenaria mercenaria]|uniref:death-associated inhibitor of apoptosis 1-like n=1 Tax=Mercenaria mercenaria TaxID=6596 RepID=UPI00234F94AF|nr:death-associated inhibitor of apoptosis 1-like [Mercenaria mercenaria]